MGEILLGIKILAPDIDITDLEAFLKATKQLDFPALMAILERASKVTITKITETTAPIATITHEILYEKTT